MAKQTKPAYNRTKFLLVFTVTVFLLAGLRALFGFNIPPYIKPEAKTHKKKTEPSQPHQSVFAQISPSALTQPTTSEENPDDEDFRQYLWTPSFRGNWGEAFADSQAVQIEAAETNGIQPVSSREELQELVAAHRLVDVRLSPLYQVDSLTHSVPYLVPKAQQLLHEIAVNFLDTLQARHLPPHLIIVSSVLRTDEDVDKLQKGNKNATENSCHRYGTTIDITYRRFQPLTGNPNDQATLQDEKLKLALAEVLYDLKQQGRCFVKYEKKQACFHLTVR